MTDEHWADICVLWRWPSKHGKATEPWCFITSTDHLCDHLDSWPLHTWRYSMSIMTGPIFRLVQSLQCIENPNQCYNLALKYVKCSWLILALALCLLAFLWSSGRGGMGYGYLLLDAIDPVEEVGDFAGDSVLRKRGSDIIKISPLLLCSGWF